MGNTGTSEFSQCDHGGLVAEREEANDRGRLAGLVRQHRAHQIRSCIRLTHCVVHQIDDDDRRPERDAVGRRQFPLISGEEADREVRRLRPFVTFTSGTTEPSGRIRHAG